MPSPGVIRYDGQRGVTWRIKYRDADGRQVMKTVGREADGVTRKHAEAERRERLVRVERGGYRRPARSRSRIGPRRGSLRGRSAGRGRRPRSSGTAKRWSTWTTTSGRGGRRASGRVTLLGTCGSGSASSARLGQPARQRVARRFKGGRRGACPVEPGRGRRAAESASGAVADPRAARSAAAL